MSVILEFSIDGGDFQLGRVLDAGQDDLEIELERVVPTDPMITPFVWVTGTRHEAFEERVRTNPIVKELLVLDTIGDSCLYRIEWTEPPRDLLEAISTSEAVVLEALGDGEWLFRLRFTDHDKLTRFHNAILEQDIAIHIERTYTLSERSDHGHRFDLTVQQREALVLALHRGYFETPSKVDLADLAAELGITKQAISTRIRSANEKVLQGVLLASTADRE